jgi:hypothetical protein
MARLLIYNPSNDMALAAGVRQYTPTKPIVEMERRQACFPEEWAETGDVVLTDWEHTNYEALTRTAGTELIPAPWGWSASIKHRLSKFGVPERLMPSDDQLIKWRELSSRSFAAAYIQTFLAEWEKSSIGPMHTNDAHLHNNEMAFPPLVGNYMRYYSDAFNFINASHPHPFIIKSPWSSSGRGIFVVQPTSTGPCDKPHSLQQAGNHPSGHKNDAICNESHVIDAKTASRLHSLVDKYGGFLMDVFYEKTLDWALEYQIHENGTVNFLGYSVFDALENGRYGGNIIASQADLKMRIAEAIGTPRAPETIDALQQLHAKHLQDNLSGVYQGYVGIDLMVVQTASGKAIHPCVEINLRMTMGIVAIIKARRQGL